MVQHKQLLICIGESRKECEIPVLRVVMFIHTYIDGRD